MTTAISILFGISFLFIGIVALYTYLTSELWLEHVRFFSIANFFWGIPFLMTIPALPFDYYSPAFVWIANTLDASGSVFMLSTSILVAFPCMRTCLTCACTDCNHYHSVCLVRFLLVSTVGIIMFLGCITVLGVFNSAPLVCHVKDIMSLQLVGKETLDVFYTVVTSSCTLISGILLFKTFGINPKHAASLLGWSFLLFSLSDSLQPLYSVFYSAGIYEHTILWDVEWGLAVLGLIFYDLGCVRLYTTTISGGLPNA